MYASESVRDYMYAMQWPKAKRSRPEVLSERQDGRGRGSGMKVWSYPEAGERHGRDVVPVP